MSSSSFARRKIGRMIGRGSCVSSQLLSLGCLCGSMGLSLAMPAASTGVVWEPQSE